MAAITRLLRSAARSPAKSSFSSLSNESWGPASLTSAASPLADRKKEVEKNVQWVFLGCPGVGKGTYASRLCNLLGVPHIATGDLVRDELKSNGPLSKKKSEFAVNFVLALGADKSKMIGISSSERRLKPLFSYVKKENQSCDALENMYMDMSLMNPLIPQKQLYTFKMRSKVALLEHLNTLNTLIMNLKVIDITKADKIRDFIMLIAD